MFRNLSSEQVEHGPQQVVAEVVAALVHKKRRHEKRDRHCEPKTKKRGCVQECWERFCACAHLTGGSGRGGGRGAGPVLQREVGDKDDELGEGASHLGARALQQVLGEAVGVRKQDVVCKPIAYILTVSEQDAEGVVPVQGWGGRAGRERDSFLREEKNTESSSQSEVAQLTNHWQDPELLSWCGNLC